MLFRFVNEIVAAIVDGLLVRLVENYKVCYAGLV